MAGETKQLLALSSADALVTEQSSTNTSSGCCTPQQIVPATDEAKPYETYHQPLASLEDENEVTDDEVDEQFHTGLQRLVLVAAATAATLGYDVGIMAAAIHPLQESMGLSSVQKELAMGSLNFVAALGAVLGGGIANEYGRKYTVKVCCWIFVAGTLLMSGAPNYYGLLLGRIVTGIGVGVSFVVAPVYLSEVSPTHLRGRLNTVFDVAINGGILLGYILGFLVQLIRGLEPRFKWRVMLGLGLVLPVVVLWNLNHLPESPRWLVMAGQVDAAHKVLRELGASPPDIQKAVSSIKEELQQEEEYSSLEGTSRISPSRVSPLNAVFRCHYSANMKLAMALGFWQQITGTEAVLYYSADFLQRAGLESPTQRLLGNCLVGLCKLTPELVAMHWVDQVGRRPLILASAVSLMVSTFFLSAAFLGNWSPLVVVTFLCLVMASFSIGLGPFSFLVASESLGLTERATGMTLCASINRCTSGTVALTAVSLYEWLGSGQLFALYGILGALSLPFYFMFLPETTGQSLEELAARNREVELQKVRIIWTGALTNVSDPATAFASNANPSSYW